MWSLTIVFFWVKSLWAVISLVVHQWAPHHSPYRISFYLPFCEITCCIWAMSYTLLWQSWALLRTSGLATTITYLKHRALHRRISPSLAPGSIPVLCPKLAQVSLFAQHLTVEHKPTYPKESLVALEWDHRKKEGTQKLFQVPHKVLFVPHDHSRRKEHFCSITEAREGVYSHLPWQVFMLERESPSLHCVFFLSPEYK